MENIVNLECFCGALKGTLKIVSNKNSFHVHCLCTDCQSFATYLKNEDKILDEHGGSELFQTYPAYLNLLEGQDNMACLQLKKGSLIRWYTSCCNTPIANTMASANMPFAGVSVKLMKFKSIQEKQNILGPVIMKAYGRSCRGKMPSDSHATFPKSFMPRILKFMFMGLVGAKYKPSPFFKKGIPVSPPIILESQTSKSSH